MNGATTLATVPLSGGGAQLTIATLAAGTRNITVVYSGDALFAGSASPILKQVVKKAPTGTSLTSSQNPSNFGQAVTFTATVVSNAGIPPGTITFKDGTNVLAIVPLKNGTASFPSSILSKGTHKISAAYGGAANYFGSSSSLSEIEY